MKTPSSSKSIKLIPSERAVKIASDMLMKRGYMKVSKSKYGSFYFAKMGTFRKIRVSTHRDTAINSDVFVDVVLDYQTIMPDIECQISRADTEYKHMLHGKKVNR